MKLIKTSIALLAFAPLLLAADLHTINIDQTQSINEVGDGVLTLKMTLNGEEFQNWQEKYGTNQSLMKRDMYPYVSQFETSDWAMQVDQMARIVTITVKIKGAVLHRGGGLFEYRVPKSWRGGELHGTVYSFNYVEPVSNGVVAENSVKVVLPAAAHGFTDDTSENGDRVIRYRLPIHVLASVLLWCGIALLVLGAALAAYGFVVLKPKAPAAVPAGA